MAAHAQGVIPTQTDLHPSTSRVLVALIALVAVTVVVIMSWSALIGDRSDSPTSTGAPLEAYDWSASRPGGSIYDSQVPEQAAENSAALRPGGSVYDSQVPRAARDD
ncbi:MAG TPA: hypothetical protein VES03_03560 [Motilibacterales bacterium]|nr:hypothetical protein [Motilibacterales bacterium]